MIRKTLESDISGAYDRIANYSGTLQRCPKDFIRGWAERALVTDGAKSEVWHNRAAHPERADAMLDRVAAELEGVIDRIHSGQDHEDDGIDDEDVKVAVAYVRDVGNLPAKLPSSLVESILISAFNSDPKAQAIWEKRHDAPAAIDGLLKFLAHQIRPLADALIALSRPSASLPDDMDAADMMNLSDKAWEQHKRRVAAANERR